MTTSTDIASALAARIDFSRPGYRALEALYLESARAATLSNATLSLDTVESVLRDATGDDLVCVMSARSLTGHVRTYVRGRLSTFEEVVTYLLFQGRVGDIDELDELLSRPALPAGVGPLTQLWRLGTHLGFEHARSRPAFVRALDALGGYPVLYEALASSRPGEFNDVLDRRLDDSGGFDDGHLAALLVASRPDRHERLARCNARSVRLALANSAYVSDVAIQRALLDLDLATSDLTAWLASPGSTHQIAVALAENPLTKDSVLDELAAAFQRVTAPDSTVHDQAEARDATNTLTEIWNVRRRRRRARRTGEKLLSISCGYDVCDAGEIDAVLAFLERRIHAVGPPGRQRLALAGVAHVLRTNPLLSTAQDGRVAAILAHLADSSNSTSTSGWGLCTGPDDYWVQQRRRWGSVRLEPGEGGRMLRESHRDAMCRERDEAYLRAYPLEFLTNAKDVVVESTTTHADHALLRLSELAGTNPAVHQLLITLAVESKLSALDLLETVQSLI